MTAVAAVLALTGCLRFVMFQGIEVMPTPSDPNEAYCHELHVTAVFGSQDLLDTSFRVGDPDGAAYVNPGSTNSGTPLTIDITCYDTDHTTIGETHLQGRLQDPRDWAVVRIVNWNPPFDCIPPTHASGTQVCLHSSGNFDWD